jgi:hypothetical protein
MPTNLRLATFNCENLFNRPKVFEVAESKSQKILKDVAALESELRRDPFDKAKIKSLLVKVKGFAKLNEVRAHLTNKDVKGPADFSGWVELIRGNNTRRRSREHGARDCGSECRRHLPNGNRGSHRTAKIS